MPSVKAWSNGKEVHVTCMGDTFNVTTAEQVDHYTVYVSWEIDSQCAHRITGRYEFGDATAELYRESGGSDVGMVGRWHQYRFNMKAKNMATARSLYDLIRGGKLLPVVSYEAVQHAHTVRQFADLWREFTLLTRLTLNNWRCKLRQS
jgi:hypothetical protein